MLQKLGLIAVVILCGLMIAPVPGTAGNTYSADQAGHVYLAQNFGAGILSSILPGRHDDPPPHKRGNDDPPPHR